MQIGELRLEIDGYPACSMIYMHVWTDHEGTVHASIRAHETRRTACSAFDAFPGWTTKNRDIQITCERCFELVEAAYLEHCTRTWGDI